MSAKPTPTPWKICYDGQIDGSDGTRAFRCPWESYKEFNEHPERDNWRLSVRCVNAMPAVVEALEKIAAIEDKLFGGDWDEIEEARSIARAALALVKGESRD